MLVETEEKRWSNMKMVTGEEVKFVVNCANKLTRVDGEFYYRLSNNKVLGLVLCD